MKKSILPVLVFAISALILTNCGKQEKDEEIKMLKEKINQYAKTEIKYDESLLDERQKTVVHKIHEAARIIDELFLEQVYSKNNEIKARLLASDDELDKLKLEYFNINFGPFDRLDHNRSFIGIAKLTGGAKFYPENVPKEELEKFTKENPNQEKEVIEKPAGANFYPEDMTKEEFEKFIKDNPDQEKAFTSEFTVIRRIDGKLTAIPYSEFYKIKLEKISALLREAAEFADNESLKNYLTLRAKAFETNDYYESDMAWMDLKDHEIEVVIGPYEVYEDGMFNYKAAFECFLTIVDPESTEKLQQFASYLTDIEKNLPLPEKYKNYDRGSESPIVVVQEVYGAGDTKAGVQTLAFNLPNDERVRKAKGSKKVMLKNLHEAKFEKLLKPIAEIVLEESELKYVTFDGFFNHTLMHEMSHGVGPGFITVDGRKTEVKKELKETYSTIEECKADILGMFNNMLMIKKGVYPESFANETWVTFLAGTFRSMRFGINEAHGGGNAIIYNYLLENGAYEYNENTQKVKVNFDEVYNVLKDLANKVLMIQAEGDYQGAKDLIAKYVVKTPSMVTLIDKLEVLPVDIKPEYQIDQQ